MYLSRHGAGCDLLSALTEPSGRKCKPGVWQVKVFPSMSENVQWLESTPATLIHLQIFALTAHCTLWSIPHVPRTGALPQAEAHEALGSLSVNRWMGMVNIQSRSIYICATQPPCPQVGGMMFKSLTGTAGIPRRQFPAPAFAVFTENSFDGGLLCSRAQKRSSWKWPTTAEQCPRASPTLCHAAVQMALSGNLQKKDTGPWTGCAVKLENNLSDLPQPFFQKSWGRCDRDRFKQTALQEGHVSPSGPSLAEEKGDQDWPMLRMSMVTST